MARHVRVALRSLDPHTLLQTILPYVSSAQNWKQECMYSTASSHSQAARCSAADA